MDEKVEVTEVVTTVSTSWKDKFVLATLGLVAGVVVEVLIEKGYYTAKARYQLRKSN